MRQTASIWFWIVLAALSCKPRPDTAEVLAEGDEASVATDSAFEVWSKLWESSATGRRIPITVNGTNTPITFGAEKEGSSGVITRVAGPTARDFEEFVERHSNIRQFLTNFLGGWAQGRYRLDSVTRPNGEVLTIDPEPFRGINYENLSTEELRAKFKEWLSKTGERPLSFMKPGFREQLYYGDAKGLRQPMDPQWLDKNQQVMRFHKWVTNYGVAENYISKVVTDEGGIWELLFVPQRTYGEFETMIEWFRAELAEVEGGRKVQFEAPGHQRVVFANPPKPDPQRLQKLKEVLRLGQAYIILREMAGSTGVEVSLYKKVFSDEAVQEWRDDRGVIRLEDNRFKIPGSDLETRSLEQRAGTKTDRTRRMMHYWLVTYAATGDFGDIKSIDDWQLMSAGPKLGNATHMDAGLLAERFGVDVATCQQAIDVLRSAKGEFADDIRQVKKGFEIPLWFWENAPFMEGKQAIVKSVTADFIRAVAKSDGSLNAVRSLMAQWIRGTEVFRDVESYLTPKPKITRETIAYKPRTDRRIDVNAIDLGIEYSAHFPVDSEAEYSSDYFRGQKDWVRTNLDLTPAERIVVLRRVAENLVAGVGGRIVEERLTAGETSGEHGHGLDLYFKIEDGQGRKWRVEWDGIGRSYNADGTVVENSLRGGHVEIVTPKFVPSMKDVEAVHMAIEKSGLEVHREAGGGHINIDLSPFEGKPEKLARFVSLFLEYRGIMSYLFQRENRLKAAEPYELNGQQAAELAGFKGNETALKKFFYNNRFYNARIGRKTKYVQLDVSGFFQDIVPDHLVGRDFDIKNPAEPWRQVFPVEPNIRKMEFRMFDAPRNAQEAALQIRFVRAMLDVALNDGEPLTGALQMVDHTKYTENPELAEADFNKMMKRLGLEGNMYRYLLFENIMEHRRMFETPGYMKFLDRIAANPKTGDWGEARRVERSAEMSVRLMAKDNRPGVVPERAELDQRQRAARAAEMQIRRKYTPGKNACDVLRRAYEGSSATKVILPAGFFDFLKANETGVTRLAA